MESSVPETKSGDVTEVVTRTAIAREVSETFLRIQLRMDDIFLSIEDSLHSLEPELKESAAHTISRISERLMHEAGLGVFASKATKIVREELETLLSIESMHAGLLETLNTSREQVKDLVSKTSRGIIRNVDTHTNDLQSKLVHVYARLNERDQEVEILNATISELRARISELETNIANKETEIRRLEEKLQYLSDMRDQIAQKLVERDAMISGLKGELGQAQSEISNLRQLIEKFETTEDLLTEYDRVTKEISEMEGTVARLEEALSQKDGLIAELQETIVSLESDKKDCETKIEELMNEVSRLKGANEALEADLTNTKSQIDELRARWEMLYQVAEDYPDFRAYFLIADKKHWFPLQHLASALGIPVVRLKQQLQRFIEIGLIELDNERIRPKTLTEVARELAGMEERIIIDARNELDEHENSNTPSNEEQNTD